MPGKPSVSRRRLGAVAHALVWACVWAAGCTLTEADFEPVVVDRASLSSDAGPIQQAPSGGCVPGAPCCDGGACVGQSNPGNGCTGGDCLPPVLATPDPVDPSAASDAGVGCVGESCPVSPIPRDPTCDDGARNGDETATDCGGSCPQACAVGSGCASGEDCSSGVCGANRRCAPPTCNDGVRNQSE